ncbi:MAG: hypothetical protein QOK05_1519 [Chloroflexota bacterium]|jgi:hypothetical protein|nr:hypothetical protein [Chloroflexota bacterium]
MSQAPRSPKSRLRAVYSVPEEEPRRTERVIYQLEDAGHPVLRLRPTVRMEDEDGEVRHLYRVDAFSRISGLRLGHAELVAPLGSSEEFAAESRQFQSAPFRAVLADLSGQLVDMYAETEALQPPPT